MIFNPYIDLEICVFGFYENKNHITFSKYIDKNVLNF